MGMEKGPGHVTVTVKTTGQYDINTVLYCSTWAWLQIDGSMDPWGMEKWPGHVTVTVKTTGQYDINTVLYGSTWAWLQMDGSMDPWGMEKGPGHVTVTVKTTGQYDINTVLYMAAPGLGYWIHGGWRKDQDMSLWIDGSMDPWGIDKWLGHISLSLQRQWDNMTLIQCYIAAPGPGYRRMALWIHGDGERTRTRHCHCKDNGKILH